MRHNEVWNIATALLTEVCHGVGIELHLQPITEEQLLFRTANREDGACLDIVAKNVWGRDRQRSFFDVRVFNPLTQTYHNTSLAQWNELENKGMNLKNRERITRESGKLSMKTSLLLFSPSLAACGPLQQLSTRDY